MIHKVGSNRSQISFRCLDDMVDIDSPARQIDNFIEGSDTHYFSKSSPELTGRPPFDPKDILKLLIYGMDKGINSTRKLARECRINIEVMWLLNELNPDSTTIRNFRRENANNLTRFFNEFAKKLCEAGYIDGRIISIDGTKIRANNSKRNNYSIKKLDRHIEYIDKKIAEYLNDVDKNDCIDELEERKAKYTSYKERIQSKEVTEVSTVDPDSRLMKHGNNGVDVSYNVQTAVDSKNKLIAGILVSNQPNDQGQLFKVAKSVKENLELEKMTVLGDKGYYDTKDFKQCHDNNISTIVAKPNERKDSKVLYKKEDFKYDKENDCYICPAQQTLKFSTNDKGYRRYRNVKACKNCSQKALCTKNNRRDMCRHEYTEHAEQNDKVFNQNQDIYKQRQLLSEHPFGTIKRTMGIRQFLTRGLTNVTAEVALIFTCYNLKRLRVMCKNDPRNTVNNCLKRVVLCFLIILFACMTEQEKSIDLAF